MHATYPVHLILLDLITRIVSGDEYRSLSSSLCSRLLHACVTSYPILKPLSQWSSSNVRDQVSHPCKIGTITVLCIYKVWDKNIDLLDTRSIQPYFTYTTKCVGLASAEINQASSFSSSRRKYNQIRVARVSNGQTAELSFYLASSASNYKLDKNRSSDKQQAKQKNTSLGNP